MGRPRRPRFHWCVRVEPYINAGIVGSQQRRWPVALQGGFNFLAVTEVKEAEWWPRQLDRSERRVLDIDDEPPATRFDPTCRPRRWFAIVQLGHLQSPDD